MNKLISETTFFVRRKAKSGAFFGYGELPMTQIDKHIIRDEKDIGFWLNPLKEGETTHKIDNFDSIYFTWLDIDFHDKQSKLDFQVDILKNYSSFNDFYKALKEDKYIFIVGFSLGGGIRIVASLDFLYEESLDDVSDEMVNYMKENMKDLYKYATNKFISYISKYNLKANSSYMDSCSTKISQPSFGLQKKGFYINRNCVPFKINLSYDIFNDIGSSSYNTPTHEVSYVDELINNSDNSDYIRHLYKHPIDDIEKVFNTYRVYIIAIIKHSDADAIKVWFEMYNKYYIGSSMKRHLTSINNFISFINNCNSLPFAGNLEKIIFNIINKK